MVYTRQLHIKAQALVEMGIFGALLLVVIIQLLSYLQTTNDQQYVTMKAFREAQHVAQYNCRCYDDPWDPEDQGYPCACDWGDPEHCFSVGAVVSNQKIDHRRYATGGFFDKESRRPVSASAHIFWGLPRIYSEGYDGTTAQIGVDAIDRFDIYTINDNLYDITQDSPQGHDSEDLDDNNINDEIEREYSGLYCDAETPSEYCEDGYIDIDRDGIPDWRDSEIGDDDRPSPALVMNAVEDTANIKRQEADGAGLTSTREMRITDRIEVSFVDTRNDDGDIVPSKRITIPASRDSIVARDVHNQYLTREDTDGDGILDTYKYIDDDNVYTVNREITWTNP